MMKEFDRASVLAAIGRLGLRLSTVPRGRSAHIIYAHVNTSLCLRHQEIDIVSLAGDMPICKECIVELKWKVRHSRPEQLAEELKYIWALEVEKWQRST